MTPLKNTARLAGLLYLIIVLASVYGHMYVPSVIFVRGNAIATANNIVANEFLFRSCIVVGLIETTAFLLLALTLYKLLKGTNGNQAKVMAALMGVQIPLALVFTVIKFMALMLVKNDFAGLVPSGEVPAVAVMLLNTMRYGNTVLAMFAALWLLPLGLLVFRSRIIPQALGVLLIIAGAGSVIYGLIAVLLPQYGQSMLPAFIFFAFGEIPIMLWLLIKGVKEYVVIEIISETKVVPKPVGVNTVTG
jgi:hypothetical protein